MGKKEFGDVVNAHQGGQAIEDFHKEQIHEWRELLQQLIRTIQQILEPEISEEKINISSYQVRLQEAALGVYTVDSIHIDVGNTRVTLEPLGTMFIGTKGRVLMRGPKGSVDFMLLRKEESRDKEDIGPEDWVWILWHEPYVSDPVAVTPENLHEALTKVLDG